mmetsp:Transcript_20090/g.68055  ORF Transcript_20090/g.68055 Transcript_20090/m.68055 type:complete len:204 (+) Transcript_20090:172-783(+)
MAPALTDHLPCRVASLTTPAVTRNEEDLIFAHSSAPTMRISSRESKSEAEARLGKSSESSSSSANDSRSGPSSSRSSSANLAFDSRWMESQLVWMSSSAKSSSSPSRKSFKAILKRSPMGRRTSTPSVRPSVLARIMNDVHCHRERAESWIRSWRSRSPSTTSCRSARTRAATRASKFGRIANSSAYASAFAASTFEGAATSG